ncbi:hypothetical protein B0T20DRAFT_45533 [Sordaria brevicollis]|uniref:Uncharacterized protein n=1 Tax=Sordaria brevicollis TaxID=83679 RepID=A0AAE0P9B4_SORBR|nr:hypothetical protein B0T20DRAFT_45533 [Sordaria brevicollis]
MRVLESCSSASVLPCLGVKRRYFGTQKKRKPQHTQRNSRYTLNAHFYSPWHPMTVDIGKSTFGREISPFQCTKHCTAEREIFHVRGKLSTSRPIASPPFSSPPFSSPPFSSPPFSSPPFSSPPFSSPPFLLLPFLPPPFLLL